MNVLVGIGKAECFFKKKKRKKEKGSFNEWKIRALELMDFITVCGITERHNSSCLRFCSKEPITGALARADACSFMLEV